MVIHEENVPGLVTEYKVTNGLGYSQILGSKQEVSCEEHLDLMRGISRVNDKTMCTTDMLFLGEGHLRTSNAPIEVREQVADMLADMSERVIPKNLFSGNSE